VNLKSRIEKLEARSTDKRMRFNCAFRLLIEPGFTDKEPIGYRYDGEDYLADSNNSLANILSTIKDQALAKAGNRRTMPRIVVEPIYLASTSGRSH
jgi:hypothetical protein